ncbi:DNA-directed RNA polymerase subunit alpha C-terminal domain-containing protein [Thalassoroseus pseudoceratinae]|uniref:DNA-directed RNA polymerase subunit alpha C-terminal domain-containing protein n=1 Tax=Thalassoroseus pseudoceratinae TaxID=2713176 RepID=UPI001F115543|nr:DNA-directed RNA polymerase subunit alpha C-terminal domain-containing protein [Thalassoroseus pseudoceratinae]
MPVAEPMNIQELIQAPSGFGPAEIDLLEQAIAGPQSIEVRQQLGSLKGEIEESSSPSDTLLAKVGIISYILGDHPAADRYLSRVESDSLAVFYHAIALAAMERYQEAAERFDRAASLGQDRIECTMRKAGVIRQTGRVNEADDILKSVATEAAGRAEYSYQKGCVFSDRGDSFGAIEYFERAVDMQPHHSRALFRLAAENALRGNDDDAIRLYEQALSKPPYYLGALLNLGLLYEDNENYPAAAYCFRQILSVDPNHERAQLYLKDIEATSNMYYDEEQAREQARVEQLLNRPVTDFELSVRARNCLQNMNIYSLGDLTRINEGELLAGKNFGETSLHEIRDLMSQHGLMIGQNINKKKETPPPYAPTQSVNLSPQEQAVLGKPISELNLSVRARKCMSRLGITTIGELVHKTQDELLGTRNFGVTSLNEVRAKLSEMDLKLRND